jgi:Right handed beta helix region
LRQPSILTRAPRAKGTGTHAAPYNTWAGLIFQPGSTYLQNAGTTYNAQLSIVHNNTGSSGAPIVLGSYGTGAKPIIHNLYVEDISWFTFNNLSFPFGVNAIPVAHVTFTNNDFSNPSFNSGFGLYLSGPGKFITISNNTFHDTLNDCMTLHTTNNTSGNGTQFLNNTIFNCGMYGITIWTSWGHRVWKHCSHDGPNPPGWRRGECCP